MNSAGGGLELEQSQMTKTNSACKNKRIKKPQSCRFLILKFQDLTIYTI